MNTTKSRNVAVGRTKKNPWTPNKALQDHNRKAQANSTIETITKAA
jgi:hypothetical protein